MSKITILHLSDIHFKKKEKEGFRYFNADVIQKMIASIKSHVTKHTIPDFTAITGDISFDGKEYTRAEKFFDELNNVLAGTTFLPIPGNHDVNRDAVDELFSLHDNIVGKGSVDQFLENEKRIKTYITPKFAGYRSFADKITPGLYEKEEDYFWVKNIPDKKVSFLGLNSAWACEGDEDRNNITLGYPQFMAALERSKDIPNRILLLHHPLMNWFNEEDFSKYINEIFKHCRLILHGHNHSDNALVLTSPDYSCICLGANASYTTDENGYIGFQFIEVEFHADGPVVAVWPYKYSKQRSDFVPDRERWANQQGKECFTIHPPAKQTGEEIPGPAAVLRIPEEYKSWVEAFHSRLSVDQLAKKGEMFTIELPSVYIPLETNNPFYKGEKEMPGKGKKKEEESKEPALIDIETLLTRVDTLLLRGKAGTGKTTLVKHLAYTITSGTPPAGLAGCLPVMIFMKDLWPIYKKELSIHGADVTFETLLKSYLEKERCPLEIETINAYLRQDRAIFLFDGLDEVPGDICGDLVGVIQRFRFTHKKNRSLFTGRPHGFSSKVVEILGANIHDIENLDRDKIEEFIMKWYRAVSGRATGFADMTAADMIGDLGKHERVTIFTQNPLLLTAVCILYLVGGKKIPDQRADLYDRIVENLIYRRFHDPADPGRVGQVREFLMQLAYFMQHQGVKSIDAYDAKKVLKSIHPKKDGEESPDYKNRINGLFEAIEPNCGLLNRLSSGDVEFYHLTFQEFLAAKHLLNMDIAVQGYLDDPRQQETVLLYTGLMNMEMKKRSNDLVNEILEAKPQNEEKKHHLWLLGAQALRDFQPINRDENNIALARDRLCAVISSRAAAARRFEAGEILGSIGDPRLCADNMIQIPAGEFTRGSNKYDNEKPAREIWLDDFMIGKYPVTNEEYKRFIAAGGYQNEKYWTPEGRQWKEENKITEPWFWHDGKWNGANSPVVGVSWYEAWAYTAWLAEQTGKPYRLPTEAEWEKAARGTGARIYPWGDDFDKDRCNSWESGLRRTSPVGIFPGGESPYGCLDMAGNVWEWCADWFGSEYYQDSPGKNPPGPEAGSARVLRGGSWVFDALYCRASYRDDSHPAYRWDGGGFRLAMGKR